MSVGDAVYKVLGRRLKRGPARVLGLGLSPTLAPALLPRMAVSLRLRARARALLPKKTSGCRSAVPTGNLRTGPLRKHVQASHSLPGFFPALEMAGWRACGAAVSLWLGRLRVFFLPILVHKMTSLHFQVKFPYLSRISSFISPGKPDSFLIR